MTHQDVCIDDELLNCLRKIGLGVQGIVPNVAGCTIDEDSVVPRVVRIFQKVEMNLLKRPWVMMFNLAWELVLAHLRSVAAVAWIKCVGNDGVSPGKIR